MSSIQEILASILAARYGKDVRQAIHDGVEMAYIKADNAETSAAAAAEAASGSQESAAASAQAASNSASSASNFADVAEQYKNEAFHTTPAGYEAFVSETNLSLSYNYEVGVKNILPNIATSKTENGITYTVNNDGTVTVNGTTTAFTEILVFRFSKTDLINTFHDTYHLSGAPVGATDGDTNGFKFYASTKKVFDDSFGSSYFDLGNGVDIKTSDTRYLSVIYIAVNQGITVNNVTFKPMLTRKVVPNSDYAHYVPFTKPNYLLTPKTILSEEYTQNTANTLEDTGVSFTLEKSAFVALRTSWSHGKPLEIAVSKDFSSNNAQQFHFDYTEENSSAIFTTPVWLLPQGSYHIATKRNGTGTDRIAVVVLMELDIRGFTS